MQHRLSAQSWADGINMWPNFINFEKNHDLRETLLHTKIPTFMLSHGVPSNGGGVYNIGLPYLADSNLCALHYVKVPSRRIISRAINKSLACCTNAVLTMAGMPDPRTQKYVGTQPLGDLHGM